MTKLQLRLGARGKVRQRGRLRGSKRKYGIDGFIPDTLFDWNVIRNAKVKCAVECDHFNRLMGGCSLSYLPGIHCDKQAKTLPNRHN